MSISRRSPFFLNGKFIAQRLTGVQRVAWQHMLALDAMGDRLEDRWTLLRPPGTNAPALARIAAPAPVGPRMPLHAWEQLRLPWRARAGLLVNLAGAAPWLAGPQACMLHDAAVFDHPEAYTRAFVTWYRALFRWLARRARLLLTVSAFSRERLAHWLRVPERRFVVVGHGADHLDVVQPDSSVIARLGLVGQRFLLAVASENPTKNLRLLLEAHARLAPGERPLLVMVGGSNRRVFAERAGAAGTPDVIHAGPVHDTELKALYRHATALVFPSLYEGFGLPPLEAMACGCPVIAARAGALPEVCADAALFVDPRSPDELTGAMRRVLADEALRRSLAQAGAQRAAGRRWSASASMLLAAVQEHAT